MTCPRCGRAQSRVRNTDPYEETIVRLRRCLSCGYSWLTEEVLREEKKPDPVVGPGYTEIAGT